LKLSLEANELPPGSGRGNLSSRLVFTGERWQSLDLCIHGQQLKWHCAECDEYFKEREIRNSRACVAARLLFRCKYPHLVVS
jgi:hypothetical protein